MEQKTIKECFDNLPRALYFNVRREILEKMRINKMTLYSWVNGKTEPRFRDREQVISIIESNINYYKRSFPELNI